MIYVLRRVVAVATTHDNPTLEYQIIIIRGFRNMNRFNYVRKLSFSFSFVLTSYLPAAYMTASMMEEIHAI